ELWEICTYQTGVASRQLDRPAQSLNPQGEGREARTSRRPARVSPRIVNHMPIGDTGQTVQGTAAGLFFAAPGPPGQGAVPKRVTLPGRSCRKREVARLLADWRCASGAKSSRRTAVRGHRPGPW